jgi:hypothetical protein
MNKLRFFVNLLSMVFRKNLPVEGTVNSMEQKIRAFSQIEVQEFYLFIVIEVVVCIVATLSLFVYRIFFICVRL